MKAGRPTKYNANFNKQVKKLCLLGATDMQIADFLEIDHATLNRWKTKYPGFCDSLKGGKILPDIKVAQSLYKRAIGYRYKEVTFEKIEGKLNLEITPMQTITQDAYKKKVIIKEVAPDVTAQIFWLKNRQKEIWRDRQSIEFENMSEQQMDEIFKKLIQHNEQPK